MADFDYHLRPVVEDDCNLLFDWRNRPEVREYMYASSRISLAEHRSWFSAMLLDKTRHFFVMSIKDVDCAVISFTDIQEGHSCSWGFYSGPYALPGISLIIELAGLGYAFETINIRRLHCEVLSGNQQVINLHKKAGFTQEGCLRKARKTPRGVEDVIIFGMLSEEWPASSARLRDRAARFFDATKNKNR